MSSTTSRSSGWHQATAVIIGASSGFGAHLAAALAGRVQTLYLIARREDTLESLARRLRGSYPKTTIRTIAADATDLTSLNQAASQIQKQSASIDLLVNAVGKSDRGRLLELTDQELQELFTVNVLTAIHGTRAFLELLKVKSGTIVNIGSLSSKFAPRFLGGYSVTKFGLAAASQQLRLELAEFGIHVMLACPGPIRRDDAGNRYAKLAEHRELPPSANAPGGGAKIRGLDPERLAQQILDGAALRKTEMMFPRKSRLLLILQAIFPSWGERMLRNSTS